MLIVTSHHITLHESRLVYANYNIKYSTIAYYNKVTLKTEKITE